jgi:hypothetical protein
LDLLNRKPLLNGKHLLASAHSVLRGAFSAAIRETFDDVEGLGMRKVGDESRGQQS